VEPWLAKLAQGDAQGASGLFLERYRPLIVATIRRFVPDYDDAMDVFSVVCEALSADDCHRLRQYAAGAPGRATVATWLVAVVRNLTLDWIRARDGRRRLTVPGGLSPLQQEIYAAICIGGDSPVEAHERICSRQGRPMPFHLFLREVRETHQRAPCPRAVPPRHLLRNASSDVAQEEVDVVETAESARRIAHALSLQPPDVRLAVELFVVERMAAADVARVVGWPNAKTVYNRVYRALAAIRSEFERAWIGPGDL
jgi:RNA polymerase sigma factor (sigma-70 family)